MALPAFTVPADAATLGPKGSDDYCKVTFHPGEKKFLQKLFDDSKGIGPHESSRDLVKAIETVFPNAAQVGSTLFKDATATTKPEITAEQRASLREAGLSDALIDDYVRARHTFETAGPTAQITMESLDLENRQVKAGDTQGPDLGPIPLENAAKIDNATLKKLVAAWHTTPAGDVHQRSGQLAAAERQAAEACKLGTSTLVVYPEISTAPTLNLSSALSSKESNFDVVVGAIITLLAAIIGGALALPNLGIKLPF